MGAVAGLIEEFGFLSDDGDSEDKRVDEIDLHNVFCSSWDISIGTSADSADTDFDFNLDSTMSVVTGLIEDFCLASDDKDEKTVDEIDSKLYDELNFICTSFMRFEQEIGENETVDSDSGSVMYVKDGSYRNHIASSGDKFEESVKDCNKVDGDGDEDGDAPADALFFALSYLGVKDLLSVERVCKSFRDAVRNDPLLWRSISIDYPLDVKIGDDVLVRLADRAQGTLRSLSLVRCFKISNNGLKRVLDKNPALTKLSVAGCSTLSVEGLLHDLKVFNSVNRPGIKHLRIGERRITTEHFKEFKLLLGSAEKKSSRNYKPRFYCDRQLYLSLDDERAIDVETCPRCQEAKQVFDCPVESCKVKPPSLPTCRACLSCIDRCNDCGCCLDNKVFEETFCLSRICLDCLAGDPPYILLVVCTRPQNYL